MTVKVAGYQMQVTQDIAQNKRNVLAAMREVAAERADFLVTPEGSLSGYHSHFDQNELVAALHEIVTLAKDLQLGLLLGTCFKEEDGLCYNQIRIHAPDGQFLGAHSKILVCTDEMKDYQPGLLQAFQWNDLCFGALVCNDLWATPGYTSLPNPYLPFQLKQMGADIIFHSSNSGSNPLYRGFHDASVEVWARSLHIPIMEVNAAQGTQKINARSGLIGRDGQREVTVPDTGEHIFYCNI